MYGTTKLSKRKQLALIKKINSLLECKFSIIGWGNIYSNYLKDNIQEEKAHNSGKPFTSGLSTREGGLYFAVRQIIDYLEGDKKPCLESYIDCRKSIYTAYSIVANYKEQIKEALQSVDYREVLNMDYCDLQQYDNTGDKLY